MPAHQNQTRRPLLRPRRPLEPRRLQTRLVSPIPDLRRPNLPNRLLRPRHALRERRIHRWEAPDAERSRRDGREPQPPREEPLPLRHCVSELSLSGGPFLLMELAFLLRGVGSEAV
ncbi:hypothetical protein HA466_0264880 [Hirschfeldia incana]|nr:hypothetical protein HA466_0264880 [Hirschfeldia incana]